MPQLLKASGRCLVLGGRGFIGSHLVDALLTRDVPVRVFGRPRPAAFHSYVDDLQSPLLEIIEGDLSNESDLRTALEGCSHCVNLVTTTLPATSNEDIIFDVQSNLIGTLNLLKYAKESGLSKIVYMSSGGTVYGNPQYLPIDEKHPTEPRSSYGITKLAAEKYLALYKQLYSLDTTVLRLANPFGERQQFVRSQGAIAVFIAKALLNEEIRIWGDGSVVRDYIYVSDCVSAILCALEYTGDETVFNIGSGEGKDLLTLLKKVGEILKQEVKVSFESSRSFDVPKSVLDIGKAQALLGWSPETAFEVGLEQTILWFKKAFETGDLKPERVHRVATQSHVTNCAAQ
jgi:UDP-glucose 4-epimerase